MEQANVWLEAACDIARECDAKTVKMLRELLKEASLSCNGTKPILRDRLVQHRCQSIVLSDEPLGGSALSVAVAEMSFSTVHDITTKFTETVSWRHVGKP